MVPSTFVFVDAFPLTANGKLDQKALPPPASSQPNLEEDFVAPRTFTEEMLAKIWCQVLHLDRIGINENFLDLGAHSLLMTQVANRVRDTFQVHLPLIALFEAPTVAGRPD